VLAGSVGGVSADAVSYGVKQRQRLSVYFINTCIIIIIWHSNDISHGKVICCADIRPHVCSYRDKTGMWLP
jgi:hypothetical protein